MSVLLLGADYYGTLAAARCYGKSGISVAMADDNRSARGLYSRWVSQKLSHPSMAEPAALIDWLVHFGERNPGTLLYPPNDHLSWLFAEERERLGKVFLMYSPAEDVIITLLDKARLHAACAKVGIDVPETYELGARGSNAPVIDKLHFPVLLKPRTQIFMEGGVKGIIVQDGASFASELARYQSLARFNRVLTDRHPEITEPMVQEYLTAAETNIFSMSGFVSEEGDFVARAAMKVLQRPRKVGIGLCFEGREIERDLADKLRALCKEVGYFGAFESEFIVSGDRRLLIDFNPRFYSQMGFDVARGLRLPILVALAARGDRTGLEEELARARAWEPTGREVYCHKTMLDLVLTLQGLSGEMSREDVKKWRRWVSVNRVTDAVRDRDDRKPALVDAAQWVQHFARHPRSFIRNFVFNK
ncbi:MAG: carbamoyl-phosphate synthase [Polyangiaceae bacterium]|nr:carbamoyl-phosphate synthase [Polyangiaceae bacterium]